MSGLTNFSTIDPSTVKNIVVTSEDTRIATRISELEEEISDQNELKNQTRAVKNLRLNLLSGQQCIRDFFLCLDENVLSWPDVYSFFGFKMTHATKCCLCNRVNQSETTQMYIELQVPSDDTNLNESVEDFLNSSSLVGFRCEDGCQQFVQAEKTSKLTAASETEFFIVILTRGMQTIEGFKLIKNRVTATNDAFIRYFK